MQYIRDLRRRPVRTALTILGITIGIWALVVFGSMANKISALVEGGSTYYADKLEISDSSGGSLLSGAPMAIFKVPEVEAVDGVGAVRPSVSILMDEQPSTVSMGVTPMITGTVAGASKGRDNFEVSYAEGRALTPEDEGSYVTVLGSDIARKYDKHVGDTLELRGWDFEVVGVQEPTLTAPDQAASIPFEAAQLMFYEALPPVIRGGLQPTSLITSMTVYPTPGEDPEVLATRIKNKVQGVAVMTGMDFDQQVGSATSMLNAILIGIALISLVVGGLSVLNTMAMSIAERTREIGIKRAIGGSRTRIVRELVIEAGLIGFIGGVIGLALGAVVVTLGNEAGRSSGTILFDLTAGTAVTAVLFSTILGAVAGLVPAVHASRLDPVTALRYE